MNSHSQFAFRKRPSQARSKQLVADILEAAIRVLKRDGAKRFTTIRVAAEAGVSVGSLYQYFPNKLSILMQLQRDEWQATGATLETILAETTLSHRERLRKMTRTFFRSELEEAPLRHALSDAAPEWADEPEDKTSGRQIVAEFMTRAAPRASTRQRRFATALLFETLSAMGRQLSDRAPPSELNAWADAVADMLWAYFAQLKPDRR